MTLSQFRPERLSERLSDTNNEIRQAASASGRNPDDVTLIAVSKHQPAEAILEALRLGQTVFGENYVQEAKQKAEWLRRISPELSPSLELHLIGKLQRNKAKDAVSTFHVIQSVDREELADALHSAAEKVGKRQKILLQVKVAEEESKSGVSPEFAARLYKHCLGSVSLEVLGLMCIGRFAPDGISEEERRAEFRLLSRLRDALEGESGQHLGHLSMGMSEDFRLAIACGATMVRVGTAIFGARQEKLQSRAPI